MPDLKRAQIAYDKVIKKRADNLEEVLALKEKAKEYGYNLSNKDIWSYTRYLPCKCGYNLIKTRYDPALRKHVIKCPLCGFTVIQEGNEDIQEKWNDVIESLGNE